MNSEEGLDVGQRLAAVLDHLGVEKAHIAVGGAMEVYDLLRLRPQVAASLVFLPAPPRFDEEAVPPLADRLVCITGSGMVPTQRRNFETLSARPGARIIQLPPSYSAVAWADIVHDHANLVVNTLTGQADSTVIPPLKRGKEEGAIEGVRFRVEGSGPPLLLFPLGLAPTQWDAALSDLNKRFTTIRLGGRHIGFVQILEERTAEGTYVHGVRTMFDLLSIGPTDRVLEVGTGTGALGRDLAGRPYAPSEIVATDINEFLLDEARFLSGGETLKSTLSFQYGNAESLPFEDRLFDVAYAVTVFEECDVEKGLAELQRVLKPGGRAGVIVRSGDLPRYWNLALPEGVRHKLNAPYPESVGATGCVDAGLYERFARLFSDVTPNPFWRCTPEIPVSTLGQATALLSPEEQQEFEEALAAGRAAGTAFAATPFHCVAGRKR